jgi:hypothetical protein
VVSSAISKEEGSDRRFIIQLDGLNPQGVQKLVVIRNDKVIVRRHLFTHTSV